MLLEWMEQFAIQFGYLGVFFISLIGTLSIIVPIPYTLIIYILGGLLDPLFVGLAAGLGSAVGEFSGYIIGFYGRSAMSKERQEKMDYMLRVFKRYGFITTFLFALTPLPDDLLFIPLGVMRYPFLKAFIPALLGKMVMSLILAYSGHFSVGIIKGIFGEGGLLGVLLTTVLLVGVIIAIMRIDWEEIFKKYIDVGTE